MLVLLAALAGPARAGVWQPASALPAEASLSEAVVVRPDGAVVAMWTEEVASGGCSPYTTASGCEVRAATLGADGAWSVPVVLSTGDASTADSELIVDADGTVTAAWLQTDGGSTASSVHARRLEGGTWGPAERLSSTGLRIYSVALAINGDDGVLAVWSDDIGDTITSRLHTGSGWESSATVPSGSGTLGVVEAAIALPDASFMISFRRVIGGYDRVAVARFAGGAWTDEGERSSVANAWPTYTRPAGLTVDPSGTVTLAMQAYDTTTGRYFIEVDRRVAGVWTGRTAIPQTSHHEQSPQVLADPDGVVTMLWRGVGADFSSGEVVRSARLSADTWTALPNLASSARATFPSGGAIALDADGDPQVLIDLWDPAISRWPTSLVTGNGSGWSAPVAIAPTAGWRASRLVYGASGVGAIVGQDWPAAASVRVYAVPPDAPRTVRGVAGDGTVRVTWEAPASFGGAPISGYTVTADPGGRTCTTAGAFACTVDGLANGTAYRFIVTATNAAGTGIASAPTGAVTPTGAPAPTPDPAPAPTPEMRTPQLPRTGPPARVRIPVEVPSAGTLRVIGMSHHPGRAKPIWRCTFEVAVEQAGTVPALCRLRARARTLLRRGPVRFTFVAVHRSTDGVVTETRSTVTMDARRAR